MRGGRKLGLHPEVLKNNNNGCKGLGRCGLGCPINAKQSMFLTYIPDAIASGAIVVTNMRAVKISDGKTKRVTAEFTPDPYQASPEEIIEEMQIEAPVVIVSCGALEGPALLQRSGLGNEMVGKNLKLHPTCTIFARFNSKIDMWHGPPQSVVIKDGHNQKGTGYGFWLEVAPFRPTLTSAIIPFYGARQFRNIKDYTKFNAGIVLVRDGADGATKGKVEWSWGKRKVHYEITRTDGTNMLLGLKMFAEVRAAAGGGGSLSVAEYVESQTSGTDGGTFTTGAWRTRTLNTEAFDPDNIATLSGNQISITNAGTYLIQYSAPAFNVTAHRARLYDITGSVEVATGGAGGAESMSSTSAVATRSEGWALVTIAATRVYELQHYSYTTKATNGFGSSTTLGTEIYSRVLVIKVA
jgi:hypothetical protein